MSQKLYLECYSGISGDMMVGALLDLGANQEVLEKALKSLCLKGFQIKINRVQKSGLDTCSFDVVLDSKYENFDHDMKFLHKIKPHNKSGESQNYVVSQTHEHRGLSEINAIIKKSEITSNAKKKAMEIFEILARAEAKAHGVDINQVHFHEVGAVDSIVDIVAAAVCLDNLSIHEVIVPVLYDGTGFINCQHGLIPVPVPAVCAIASENNLSIHITESQGEFVTPTGAAIVAAIITSKQLPKQFSISKIGLGAGKRNYDRPSILRAMLITEEKNEQDFIYQLETNIDDCSGEILGYVMELLFEAGARDVSYIPVFMKKNRPAYQLNVICSLEDISKIEEIIFKQTTTIGIRRQKIERTTLKREIKTIETSLGVVQVKVCEMTSGRRIYPEYSSVVEKCKKYNLSYQEAYSLIQGECNGKL